MLLRKPLQTIEVSVLRKWYGRAVHRLGSPARAGHESMPERVAQRPADAPLRAAASSASAGTSDRGSAAERPELEVDLS